MIEVTRASGEIQLLFVTGRTSGVGRRMESVIASLQARNRGRVAVHRLDADAQPELAAWLGVRSIPTVLFLRDRQPIACLRGRATLEELEQVLERCA
ncbi:MAG TPA: thioredoxin domain-containing protein [Gaiellaceae bacterium]